MALLEVGIHRPMGRGLWALLDCLDLTLALLLVLALGKLFLRSLPQLLHL